MAFTRDPSPRPPLLSAALLALCGCASARATPALNAEFDLDASHACLARARAVLRRDAATFDALQAELRTAGAAPPRCAPMNAEEPFAAFEGPWQGHWRGVPVRHLWRTIHPGVQLVLLEDGGQLRRGINLRGYDGTLCGIVVEPDGAERLHTGRYVRGASPQLDLLVWSTPDRVYAERATCRGSEATYQIVEHIRQGGGLRERTRAHYTRPRGLTTAHLISRVPGATSSALRTNVSN